MMMKRTYGIPRTSLFAMTLSILGDGPIGVFVMMSVTPVKTIDMPRVTTNESSFALTTSTEFSQSDYKPKGKHDHNTQQYVVGIVHHKRHTQYASGCYKRAT